MTVNVKEENWVGTKEAADSWVLSQPQFATGFVRAKIFQE